MSLENCRYSKWRGNSTFTKTDFLLYRILHKNSAEYILRISILVKATTDLYMSISLVKLVSWLILEEVWAPFGRPGQSRLVSIHPSIHLFSTLYPGSGRCGSSVRKPIHPFPSPLPPAHPKAFPGQSRDITPPVCPGSAPGALPGWTCLKCLH